MQWFSVKEWKFSEICTFANVLVCLASSMDVYKILGWKSVSLCVFLLACNADAEQLTASRISITMQRVLRLPQLGGFLHCSFPHGLLQLQVDMLWGVGLFSSCYTDHLFCSSVKFP